jgi:hypothetical protein
MADDDTASFKDLLGALDATARRRLQQDEIRPFREPRIPYVHDLATVEWQPLPKLEAVRHTLQGGQKPFIKYVRNCGSELSEPDYLAPKPLGIWKAERVVQPSRNYVYPNIAPPRFHSQPEPFAEPTDDLCDALHRSWLQKHYATREHQLYPVAHAIDKVRKAKDAYEVHQARREKTRDIVTRQPREGEPNLGPKMSAGAIKSLQKVRKAVKAARAFNATQDINPLKEAEEKDHARLLKAQSAPILRFKEEPPASRPVHLRAFAKQNVSLRSFRHSTPWLHEDETRELKLTGKMH